MFISGWIRLNKEEHAGTYKADGSSISAASAAASPAITASSWGGRDESRDICRSDWRAADGEEWGFHARWIPSVWTGFIWTESTSVGPPQHSSTAILIHQSWSMQWFKTDPSDYLLVYGNVIYRTELTIAVNHAEFGQVADFLRIARRHLLLPHRRLRCIRIGGGSWLLELLTLLPLVQNLHHLLRKRLQGTHRQQRRRRRLATRWSSV